MIEAIRLGILSYRALHHWSGRVDLALNVVARPLVTVISLTYFVRFIGSEQAATDVMVGAAAGALFWSTMFGVMQDVSWERTEGYVPGLITARIPCWKICVGRVLVNVPIGFGAVLICTLSGHFLFRFDVSPNWAGLLVLALIGSLTVAFAGLVAGSLALAGRDIWVFFGAIASACYVLSGVVVPIETLPWPLQRVSAVIPLRWASSGMKDAYFGAGVSEWLPFMAWESLLWVTYWILGVVLFRAVLGRVRSNAAWELL